MNYQTIAKATLLTLICFITLFATAYGQDEIKIRRSTLRAEKVGFLEAYENVLEGDRWAKKGIGSIPKALKYYLLAAEYNMDCPELNYKIALCYLRTDHKAKAIEYFKAAYDKYPEVAADILYIIGEAYQFNMEFKKAQTQYNAFYKSLRPRDQERYADRVYKRMEECKAGIELAAKPQRVVIKNLGDSVNSIYDDYNAVLFHGDSAMYFTSRRPSSKKERPDKINSMFDEDIYASRFINGSWANPTYINDKKLNTKHNEAVVWVSEDGNTRYLYNGYSNNGDIFESHFKNNKWSRPKKIRKGLNTDDSETSMSITADGNTFYFVSNEPDNNIGGKDIFYCVKNKKGKWQRPKNIGSVINTKYDEEGVYVKPDGKVLFFSSKGHNSIGGYDIFRSEKDSMGSWSAPVNIGFPINTPDNELFYRPSQNEKTAYYSANRMDTKGGYDIYKVIHLGEEKEMILKTDHQLISYLDDPSIEIFAHMPSEVKIDTSVFMVGYITDTKSKAPVMAKLDLIDVDRSQVVATILTDSTGKYKVKLPEIKNYGVEIHAKDYMFYLDIIKISRPVVTREITNNFSLTKLEVGTKIVLKNIYFDLGKATLKPESNTELDKVVKFMQENADLKIEISGHTDNVGSEKSNTKLSEARAKSVVDYLILHNIPQERLVYKGYGFSQPIAPNTTADGRQMNRRVEFKILSKQ